MHIPFTRSRQLLRVLFLGAVCIASSFVIGIQSAGEVRPIALIEAGSLSHVGDMDGSGSIDMQDAILILEIAQGYRIATPEQLQLDPNEDGNLTVDDALRILRSLP